MMDDDPGELMERRLAKRVVGSDIIHALMLVGISALGHLRMGNVDFPSVGALLLGSVPGVWVGSKMSAAAHSNCDIVAHLLNSSFCLLIKPI